MIFRKKNEEGSAAFAGIASIAALALATMMVQQMNTRMKSTVDESKEVRAREASNIGAENSLARFKSLISSRKWPDSTYVPIVFAVNYYDKEWHLVQKKGSEGFGSFDFSAKALGTVRAGKQNLSDGDLRKVMDGKALTSMPEIDSFAIKVIKPNFEKDSTKPGFGTLVTSVDVTVTGKAELKNKGRDTTISARVAVDPPQPRDIKIQYRKTGSSDALKTVKEGEDLSDGEYDFFIVSSGVAYDGVLKVDGKEVHRTMPLDSEGRITHKAVNYDAVDIAISEPIKLKLVADKADAPAGGSGSGGAKEVDDGDSFNQSNCTYVPAGGGGGGGGTGGSLSISPTATGSKTMQAFVYGPDGTTEAHTDEFKVKTEAPAPPGGGKTNDGSTKLSQADYANLCAGESECTWVPDDPGDGSKLGEKASYFRPTGDISSLYTYKQGHDPGKWQIYNKKVCFNFAGVDNSTHNLDFSKAMVVVYNTKTCTKKPLFQRTSCGCVTADTQITLGDGVTTKRIDEILGEDLVWNPLTKKAMPIRKITAGPEKIPMIAIKVAGKEIRATGKHPFITRRGIVPAYQLNVGEEIQIDAETFAPIDSTEAVPVGRGETAPVVWNIEIDAPDDDHEAHNLVANGITTGDLMIQTKLESGLIR